MHTQPSPPYKLLLILLFFANIHTLAHACSPALGEKAASIASKAQSSSYVFDGLVTEITDTYIKVKGKQYFKGEGLSEVKIALGNNSCSDTFILDQRGLFFTQGDMEEILEPIYDGAFGSVRTMGAENFSKITATTECMATFQDGNLTVPCLIHQETQKTYQATLAAINSSNGLTFAVSDVEVINANHSNKNTSTTGCMASYKNGILTAPCIAYKDNQTVYLATLIPMNATDSLNFSVSHVSAVSKIQHVTHFDQGQPGTAPNNWEQGITGDGLSDWKLENDSTAPSSPLVLKQSGYGDYPWCIKKDSHQTDGFVAVKFKAISGGIDEAAGLIWRWKDADNYYVARANALEDNISIYYMKDGRRHAIRYVNLPQGQSVKYKVWQSLRVDFQDDHFIVSFEGKIIVNVRDNHIKGEGAVGLWTKEDSVTSFDDFSYGGL